MSNEPDLPQINCQDNGPLIVTGLSDLKDADGKSIPTRSKIALCRCGASSTKPFCDGTHARIGFKSENDSERVPDRRKTYTGKKIAIHDNRALCVHAGVCVSSLPSVWRLKQRPWIDPDAADVAHIIDVIEQCPSGALSYSIEGEEAQEPERTPAIQVATDGPYKVTGDVQLVGQAWSAGAPRQRYTLCRCGASKNKPFCDGSHSEIGFKDDATSSS